MTESEGATETSPEQIAEYEEQLAGIEQLLALTPEDESLLALKNDIVELLQLTKGGSAASDDKTADDAKDEAHEETPAQDESEPKKESKKRKKSKDKALIEGKFQIPEHLIPLETDTDAERNKKRRAAKVLKDKFRAKKKEAVSAHKQKTWQSFLSKGSTKKKTKKTSIFSTGDSSSSGKVGVISKQTYTGFDSRKRHKKA